MSSTKHAEEIQPKPLKSEKKARRNKKERQKVKDYGTDASTQRMTVPPRRKDSKKPRKHSSSFRERMAKKYRLQQAKAAGPGRLQAIFGNVSANTVEANQNSYVPGGTVSIAHDTQNSAHEINDQRHQQHFHEHVQGENDFDSDVDEDGDRKMD